MVQLYLKFQKISSKFVVHPFFAKYIHPFLSTFSNGITTLINLLEYSFQPNFLYFPYRSKKCPSMCGL